MRVITRVCYPPWHLVEVWVQIISYVIIIFFFRRVWFCSSCNTNYCSNEIERMLISLIQTQSMAYVLQDLLCDRCSQVRHSKFFFFTLCDYFLLKNNKIFSIFLLLFLTCIEPAKIRFRGYSCPAKGPRFVWLAYFLVHLFQCDKFMVERLYHL